MKQIRKDLKLSQQDLALLLNVSRSAIAMYEKGIRNIPAKALKNWLQMQDLWLQNQRRTQLPLNAPDTYITVQRQQSLSFLNAHVQRAAARTIGISQQLSCLEQRHRQLLQQLHFLKELMRKTHPESRKMKLLKNREQLALGRLTKCCPERRQLLAFKLQVLAALQKAALAGKVMLQQIR